MPSPVSMELWGIPGTGKHSAWFFMVRDNRMGEQTEGWTQEGWAPGSALCTIFIVRAVEYSRSPCSRPVRIRGYTLFSYTESASIFFQAMFYQDKASTPLLPHWTLPSQPAEITHRTSEGNNFILRRTDTSQVWHSHSQHLYLSLSCDPFTGLSKGFAVLETFLWCWFWAPCLGYGAM